jgi:hypothetical protein
VGVVQFVMEFTEKGVDLVDAVVVKFFVPFGGCPGVGRRMGRFLSFPLIVVVEEAHRHDRGVVWCINCCLDGRLAVCGGVLAFFGDPHFPSRLRTKAPVVITVERCY